MLFLFLSAFLAATWLPFSSEAILVALVWSDHYAPSALWISATSGNVLGSVFNWMLGRYVISNHGVTQRNLHQAQKRFLTYGKWSLLFAWVPLLGEPLTFIAGVFRVPLWQFILFMIVGKGGRYGIMIYLV